jgi:hypothetical protein
MLQSTLALRLNDDAPPCEADKCPFAFTRWGSSRLRVAFVDEQVRVDVDIANPFAIPIQFVQAHAVCDFEPSSDVTTTTTPAAVVPAKQTFDVQFYDILLCPSESKRASFAITPRSEGTLRLRGIAFNVCASVWGIRRFTFVPPKKGETEAGALRVAAAMPYLRVEFQGFPAWAVEGELTQVVLLMHNASPVMSASDIRIAFSHPSFFSLNREQCRVSASFIQPGPPVTPGRASANTDDTDMLAWLAIDAELPPNGDLALPFWFRVHGNCTSVRYAFHTAVSYKASARASQMRFAHVHTHLSVQPAVRITHTLLPNAADINSVLLKLHVENLQTGLLLRIRQFSCLSKKWTIGTLYPIAEQSLTLRPKEHANFFLNVAIAANNSTESDTKHTVVVPTESTAIDASQQPYGDFVEKESLALWEARKGGKGFAQAPHRARSVSPNHAAGSSAFGLSAFGALPSFANAHLRAVKEEVAQRLLPPETNGITLIWETASATAAGPATVLGVSNLCIPPQSLPCASDPMASDTHPFTHTLGPIFAR